MQARERVAKHHIFSRDQAFSIGRDLCDLELAPRLQFQEAGLDGGVLRQQPKGSVLLQQFTQPM